MTHTEAQKLKEAHATAVELRARVEALEAAYTELLAKLAAPKRGRPKRETH